MVIGLCSQPGAQRTLRRFAWLVGALFTLGLALIATTPLADFWFGSVIGLEPELVEVGVGSLWIGMLIPLLTFLQSLYQGVLVQAHKTRYVTESVALFLLVTASLVFVGIWAQPEYGVKAVLGALTIGNLVQAGWLWHRCRTRVFRSVEGTHGALTS